jgi:hypothetical protein
MRIAHFTSLNAINIIKKINIRRKNGLLNTVSTFFGISADINLPPICMPRVDIPLNSLLEFIACNNMSNI